MSSTVKPGQLWKWKTDRLSIEGNFAEELVLVISCVQANKKLVYKCIDFGFAPPRIMYYDFGQRDAKVGTSMPAECSFVLVQDV